MRSTTDQQLMRDPMPHARFHPHSASRMGSVVHARAGGVVGYSILSGVSH
jgi:hypothetical protein